MSAQKNGAPAFPHANPGYDGNWDNRRQIEGMSQRAYIATKAMQAIVSNPALVDVFSGGTTEFISRRAVEIADALLAALEQQP